MRRRRSVEGEGISLFPFLSILACTLGFLLIIAESIIAISLGAGKTVTPVEEVPEGMPEGTTIHRKKPTYIEWDGVKVIVHPEVAIVPWALAQEDDGDNETAFGELLQRIKASNDDEYIIVMVRPSGFANFGSLRALIRRHGIDIGYTPLEQELGFRVRKRGTTH